MSTEPIVKQPSPLDGPLNVLVVGASVSANKGAQAMALVALDEMREIAPKCRFRLLSKYPDQDAPVATTENIELVSGPPGKLVTSTLIKSILAKLFHVRPRGILSDSIIRAYADADIVIDLSGVAFSDDRDWRGLLLSMGWLMPSLACGTPVARLAQAVGPFRKPVNRLLAKRMLSKCGLIIARGESTDSQLKDLFPNGQQQWHICADTAFLLRASADEKVDAVLEAQNAPINNFIGLSLSAVVDRRNNKSIDYRKAMCDLINRIRHTTDRPVVLIPHASAQGSSASEDHELHLAIAEALDDTDGVHVLTGEFDSRLLKGLISRADAFVTSRFHAMVAALGCGVPTMVIGWMHKYPETMALFNVEEFSHSFASASPKTLQESFDQLWAERDQVRNRICKASETVMDSAKQNYSLLREFIERSC